MEGQPKHQIKPLLMLGQLPGGGIARYEVFLLPSHELVRVTKPKFEELLCG